MYEDKQPCPKCGKRTMPKVWLGLNPLVCDNCGYTAEQTKVEYKITA